MKAQKRGLSPQHVLLGKRRKRGSIDAQSTLDQAVQRLGELPNAEPVVARNVRELKPHFVDDCRLYYTLAAVSRRAQLDAALRHQILARLYPLRSKIERAIMQCLPLLTDQKSLWADATAKSFFGVSAKQGVSVRFGLSSCVPTRQCGGRCYGHDGRDRELHLVFRSVLNQFVGESFEAGDEEERAEIMDRLSKAITYGIDSARKDAAKSLEINGFSRAPRIRFSHIGEMAHTPEFTNTLAREIGLRAPDVTPVIYARHPNAGSLDSTLLVLNFTIEGADDERRRYAPPGSRLVNSSWNGELAEDAAVNFLEHHVEKTVVAIGKGHVCPVTADHHAKPSCDSAKCDLCFRSPRNRKALGAPTNA